jgi:hypothetical protein
MSAAPDNNPEEIFKTLRKARLTAITVMAIPAAILLASGILMAIDEHKGYQAVKLPGIFLSAYTICWIASPLIGIVLLLKTRRLKGIELTDEQRRLASQIRLWGAAAILAVVPWTIGSIFVLFSTGFSR